MMKKKVLLLVSVSALSLAIVGGVLLTHNSGLSFVKGDSDTYSIEFTKDSVNVTDTSSGIDFDLVSVSGKFKKPYTTSGRIWNGQSANLTVGGDHILSSYVTGFYPHYLQLPITLKGIAEDGMIGLWMEGTFNGVSNNNFHRDAWYQGYDEEKGEHNYYIYLDSYSSSDYPVSSMTIDKIIIEYTC